MSNPYLPVDYRLVELREEATNHFYMAMVPPAGVQFPEFRPGQFFEVSVPGLGEAPLSVSSSPTRPGTLEMCFRRMGRVTGGLSRLDPGSRVGIRGPLGNGYPLEKARGRDVLVIAGGLGIVPLRSLIRNVADRTDEFGHLTILYGVNRESDFLFFRELVELGEREKVTLRLIVMNPSEGSDYSRRFPGQKGLVTQLIPGACPRPRETFTAVCGPPVFYRPVVEMLLKEGFNKGLIFMSLERRMECGVGKCGHCTMGYRYTCIEGPIFNYWDAFNLPELVDIGEGEPWIRS